MSLLIRDTLMLLASKRIHLKHNEKQFQLSCIYIFL